MATLVVVRLALMLAFLAVFLSAVLLAKFLKAVAVLLCKVVSCKRDIKRVRRAGLGDIKPRASIVLGTAAGALAASKEAGCCKVLRPFSDCSSQHFCYYGAGRQRDPANCDSLMEHALSTSAK